MKFDKDSPFNELPNLPPKINLDTVVILKATINANKLLAELKGYCQTLPNPKLLLNTVLLQESRESNEIENIVTTQDELYKATLIENSIDNSPAKEVLQYREAMYWGLEQMQKTELITTNLIVGIMQRIRNTNENIRKNSGTKLANPTNGAVVYTPPEGEELLRNKLAKLEEFINDSSISDLDPLVKMALIHYQFEAIHPFNDGNGRTGRILNVLFLIQQKLLGLPVLYLSHYIIQNKPDYYRLLKEITEKGNWEEWVLFVVNGVAETSSNTLEKINRILLLKSEAEREIKIHFKSSFSKELVELIFSYPYIKISVLEKYNIAKRQTASEYLKKIESLGWLKSFKMSRDVYYVNYKLIDILSK
jgi:Fic family protein